MNEGRVEGTKTKFVFWLVNRDEGRREWKVCMKLFVFVGISRPKIDKFEGIFAKSFCYRCKESCV
jgi:hypothetical protein